MAEAGRDKERWRRRDGVDLSLSGESGVSVG